MGSTKTKRETIRRIPIQDREAVRLIENEAAQLSEPLAKVASRCIIRYFAMRQQPISGQVS